MYSLLKHPVVQFAAVFGVAYFALKNAFYALIAGAVLVGISYGLSLAEFMSGSIFPDTDIYPGCESLTAADILAVFKNEAELKQAFKNHGIQESVSDTNAPIIGTKLVYGGYSVSGVCKGVYFDKVA